MSKHSIRIGIASMPSAFCRPSSASMRATRRCSERSRSWSSASRALRSGQLEDAPLVAALGVAHLDRRAALVAERLLQHLGLREAARHDHLRRDRRRGGVVLEDELLRHLALLARGRVLQVEALTVGQHAVAHLEDLGVGVGALGRHGHRVERAHRLVRDPLALEQRAHRLEPVAVHRRLLELLLGRRLLHLRLEVALDLAVAARQEGDDRLDALAVLLLRHVADAGRLAALDEVVEAGAAGARGRARARRRCGTGRPCRAGRASRARAWRWRRGRSRRGRGGGARA